MSNALKFRSNSVPRQKAEQARLKVVQGPDYGTVYVLTGTKATVGRGEENDVIISDLKASRRHAELALGPGGWAMRDLGSSNGILFRGKAVRGSPISSGETFSLGETTFEFLASEAGTLMLVAPPKSLAAVNAGQQALEDQKKRVQTLGRIGFGAGPSAAGAPAAGASLFKNKAVLLGLVAGAAALLFLGGEDPPVKSGPKKPATEKDLAAYLPRVDAVGNPAGKTADMFFKDGFREFTAKNYLRARTQFETVLQMSPSHPLATLYLDSANKAIEDMVKFHLGRGKRAASAGKLREARGHYETVLRTLFRDQTNPGYTEALEQLEKVNLEIRGEVAR